MRDYLQSREIPAGLMLAAAGRMVSTEATFITLTPWEGRRLVEAEFKANMPRVLAAASEIAIS